MEGLRGRRGLLTAAAALGAALGVFLLFTLLGVGKPASTPPPAPTSTYAVLAVESPHVLSSYSFYSVAHSAGALAPTAPAVKPLLLVPADFIAPVARYRRYADAQLALLEFKLERLKQTLAANDTAAAKRAWSEAYGVYLRLGAVYLVGSLGELNDEIDGTAGGLSGGVHNPRFSGLHRLEYGLWTGASPASLLGTAARLKADVQRMRRTLPHVAISPLEYATRAHEILEDAVRDELSGADVPWSGEGVVATEAGLRATEEVISTLHPLLHSEEEGERPLGPPVEAELERVRAVMSSLLAAHGGRLPSNRQLTQSQSTQLDGTLGGALETLAALPGALEAEPRPTITPIPQKDVRIDP